MNTPMLRLTLRAWYGNHFLQLYHLDADPRTVAEYKSTLKTWEDHTSDPMVGDVSALVLADFRGKLVECGELARTTINKHLRHLNHLLGKLGPPCQYNRDAMGILSYTPWAKQLKTKKRTPKAPSLDDVRAMQAVGETWINDYVTAAYYLGSRWEAITGITEQDIDFEAGTIIIQAENDKRDTERRKPMPEPVREIFIRRREHGLLSFPQSRAQYYRLWRKTLEASGLPKDRQFTAHDLRRTTATELALAGASPWAVQYALDHVAHDITGIAYLAPYRELEKYQALIPKLLTETRVQSPESRRSHARQISSTRPAITIARRGSD